MNIRDEGNIDVLPNFRECAGGFFIGNGNPDDLTPCFLKLLYLIDRCPDIPRVGARHRLNDYRGISAYLDITKKNRFRSSSFCRIFQGNVSPIEFYS
jgi:hypothetical protein